MYKHTQKAVVLHPGGRRGTETDVPQPSGQPGGVHPSDYREFLPGADADHLLAADVLFSTLTGKHAVVIYDASGIGQPNPCASRLTTNVETGDSIEIKGDALLLYQAAGHGLGIQQWEELDNVIYDELMEYFGQGLKPAAADIARLVKDFGAGKFQYAAAAAGGEDENKDDGGEKGDVLPGWG